MLNLRRGASKRAEGGALSVWVHKDECFNCTLSSVVKYTFMSAALCVYLLDTKLWVLCLGSSLPRSKSLQRPWLKCPVSVSTRKAQSQSVSPLNLWPYSFVPESIMDCLLTLLHYCIALFLVIFLFFKNFCSPNWFLSSLRGTVLSVWHILAQKAP